MTLRVIITGGDGEAETIVIASLVVLLLVLPVIVGLVWRLSDRRARPPEGSSRSASTSDHRISLVVVVIVAAVLIAAVFALASDVAGWLAVVLAGIALLGAKAAWRL